ncbi:MAG: hypothetical protein COT18_11220 [Elusimicrobia bacterium CG08_land_8_20_14_0_20_59_10]|nr:MAG: hypothetical protein COT18_11220 [Elusimicrobia bacterium CG08_land_8_20_14_0_20_59_10]
MFIKLRVHPDAKRDKVVKRNPDTYEIWTRAKAERGLANAAALRALALTLGLDMKRILLIKGAHSPAKIVKVL